MNILYAFFSIILISALSLIWVLFFLINKDLLKKIILILVAFAVWAMLGDAFLHIIPHVFEGWHSEKSSILILFNVFMVI